MDEIFESDGVPEADRPKWWAQPVDKDDPDVNPGIDDELPLATGDIRFAPPGLGERASDDVADAMFMERFNQLVEEGKDVLYGPDFVDLALRVRRSPLWIHRKLDGLVTDGRLEPVDDGFRVVRGRTSQASSP